MKLYLSLTKIDDKILITLRHSTATTEFKKGVTIKHLMEKDKVNEYLIKLLKSTERQIKETDNILVDIKFKGDS
jgi:hypothetical protein